MEFDRVTASVFLKINPVSALFSQHLGILKGLLVFLFVADLSLVGVTVEATIIINDF